jgi:hypothetical protein
VMREVVERDRAGAWRRDMVEELQLVL